ncbi:protein of unknown function 724 1 [Euphorbia peplus]|nr:protein of unknown function 724 1 [Euphorbia peplus]
MVVKGKPKNITGFLSKESMVEVARNKQGSKGSSWYTAKILQREGNRNLLVEYQTLFSVNQKLTENVDISSIRPLPPPSAADQSYEAGDVVDAFHCGGWWKGVVGKVEVLEDGSRRYNVVLENSSQEELEFFRSDSLRFHLVCNGGRWVLSSKLKELPNTTQCEEQSEHADNIAENAEVVVSVMSSTSLRDQTEEASSCKMSYAIAINRAHDKSSVEKSRKYPLNKDCAGEHHNVFEGSATDTKSKVCASKMSEFSRKRDMEDIEGNQEGHVKNSNESSVMIMQSNGEPVKTEEMPFVKSSSFWEYVDSLDVFKFLPQKPHFTPLFDCINATREGYAIGHMLNFANVVEKTSELKVEKSREVFDSYLEVLANLEMFGFDVKVVVERIYKLLSIKSQKEQLLNRSKGIDSKIAECNGEKAKVEEEINAINKMISELEERRAVKLSEKATKDSEINLLHNDASSISSNIVNLKLDFESQVAAPW